MTASVNFSAASRSTTQSISIDEMIFGSDGPGPVAQVNFDPALGTVAGFSLGGRHAGMFTISATGAISFTSQSLTPETTRPPLGDYSFHVEAMVRDESGHSQAMRTGTVTLTVNDVVEYPDLEIDQAYDIIPENIDHGIPLVTVALNDPDRHISDIHGRATVELAGEHAGMFDITGSLQGGFSVHASRWSPLDYEAAGANGRVDLDLVATYYDRDGAPHRIVETISLTIGDVPEPVTFASGARTFDIDEQHAVTGDITIGTVGAQDGDGDPVRYEITGAHRDRFGIDETTGEIFLRQGQSLDYETARSFDLTVTATSTPADGSAPASTATQQVRINVSNILEPPEFIGADGRPATGLSADTDETDGQGNGVFIQFLQARVESFFGATLSYELRSQQDRFEIRDGNQLWLKAGAALDHEAAATIPIRIAAIAEIAGPFSAGRRLESVVTLELAVNDVDERPTSLEITPVTIDGGTIHRSADGSIVTLTVPENTPLTKLADLLIRDPDSDEMANNNPLRPLRADSGFEFASETLTSRGGEIHLREGVTPDFETRPQHTSKVRIDKAGSGRGDRPDPVKFVLRVTDVDEAPTEMRLSQEITQLDEGTYAVGKKLASVSFEDDALGTNSITIAESPLFEIRNGTELWLKDGAALDHEALADGIHRIELTPDVSGTGAAPAARTALLEVLDVPEPPRPSLVGSQAIIDEGRHDGGPTGLSFTVEDDDGDRHDWSVSDSRFTVNGRGELMINPGSAFDFESEPQIDLMVTVTDQTGLSGSEAVSLGITDIDEVPTAMTLSSYGIRLDEGPITARKLADIAFTDDALGTNQVQEIDHSLFEVRRGPDGLRTELWLKAGQELDFETLTSHGVTLTPDVTGTGPSLPPQSFTLTVLDVDEPPETMTLSQTGLRIAEGVTVAQKLADITFEGDDALGTDQVQMIDHPLFEIREDDNRLRTELWLKGGVELDFETLATHPVTLRPDVTGRGQAPAAQEFTLTVIDVDEKPAGMVLDVEATSLAEGTYADGLKLADVRFPGDDALGTNQVHELTHTLFEIREGDNGLRTELWLKAGAVLDFETLASHPVTLRPDVTGRGTDPADQTFTLTVTDVDEKPTRMGFSIEENALAEGHYATGRKLAVFSFTDDGLGTNGVKIAPSEFFEIRRSAEGELVELWLKDNVTLDYETVPGEMTKLIVTPVVTGIGDDLPARKFFFEVTDEPEPPVLTLGAQTTGEATLGEPVPGEVIPGATPAPLPEGQITAATDTGHRLILSDDAGDTHRWVVSDDRFAVTADGALTAVAGARFDFETESSIDLTVTVTDQTGRSASQAVTVAIGDVDEQPSALALSQTSFALDEGVTAARKLADLIFTDDALGTNQGQQITHDLFELRADANGRLTELWLKGGVTLDYEAARSHSVSIASGSSGAGTAPADATFTLDVNDLTVTVTRAVVETNGHQGVIQSNMPVGAKVGQITASTDTGKPVSYEIVSLTGARFDWNDYLEIRADGGIYVTQDLPAVRSFRQDWRVVARAGDESSEEKPVETVVNTVFIEGVSDLEGFEGRQVQLSSSDLRSELDGDTISLLPITGAQHVTGGSYQVDANGRLIFTPTPGFVGNTVFDVDIRDSRGFETTIPVEINVRPELTVADGFERAVDWAALDLFGVGGTAGAVAGMTVSFTHLPARGRFLLDDGSGIKSAVTIGQAIAAADIIAGRLTFRAEAGEAATGADATYFENAGFTVSRPDGSTAGGSTVTNASESRSSLFSIAVNRIAVRDVAHIGDSGSPAQLHDAYDADFVTVGTKTFLVVTGLMDAAVNVFEFDRRDNSLTFRHAVDDSDNSQYALRLAHGIGHAATSQGSFVYVTSPIDNGITIFELGLDGRLSHVGTVLGPQPSFSYGGGPRQSTRGADTDFSTQYALSQVGSVNIVEFDSATYLVASGRTDTGFSVFAVNDDGTLAHQYTTRGPVTPPTGGGSISLRGESHGTVVRIGDDTFFVLAHAAADALLTWRMTADGRMILVDAIREVENRVGHELDWPLFGDAFTINGVHYVAVPARMDDGIGIYRIGADGTITAVASVDDDAATLLDFASDSQHFRIGGHHYLAVTSHDDDGVSIFRLGDDGAPTLAMTLADNGARRLDGATMLAMTRNQDGNIILVATGVEDDGFSLFEISLTRPAGTVPQDPAVRPLGSSHVTLVEGVEELLTLDDFGLTAADFAGGAQLRFTALPGQGSLTLAGSGSARTTVTTSTVISLADITGGRLSFTPPEVSSGSWLTASYSLASPVPSGSSAGSTAGSSAGTAPAPVATGHLALAVRNVTIRDLQHIEDSDNSRYELNDARDVKFIDIGDRTFLLASSHSDDGVTVFEFNPATKRLTFTDSVSDNSTYALNSASVMVHLEKGGRHFVYVSGNEDDGITRFTLTSDGQLTFENTPGAVVRNSQDSRYTMDGGRSLTLARFDNADYLIAAGNSDTGFTVFRIAGNGDLNFVHAVTAPATGDNGQSLSLGNLWGGIMAEISGQQYFVIGSATSDSLFVYRMASDGSMTLTDTLTDTSGLELNDPRFGDSFAIDGRTYLTIAAGNDDGFGVYELSAGGRLSVISSVPDTGRLELDGAWDSKTFTLGGQTFIVTTGSDEDGFSIFVVADDGTPRFLRSVADNAARQLDFPEHVSFTLADDGGLVMAVAGHTDDGISLFEIDLDDPAGLPVGIPAPDVI